MFNTVDMVMLSKAFCYFTTTPIKIPTTFFTEIDKKQFSSSYGNTKNQGSKKILNNKITDGNAEEGNSQSQVILLRHSNKNNQ